MRDLSALTTDELLRRLRFDREFTTLPLNSESCDELLRRLSAGEQAEKELAEVRWQRDEADKLANSLTDWLAASEARVAELEATVLGQGFRMEGVARERDRLRAALERVRDYDFEDVFSVENVSEIARRALSAGSET